MNEQEEADSTNVDNPFTDCDDGCEGMTATPLKKYVTILGDRKDGSACKWTCNFSCRVEPYTGTYSRMRAHLIGLLPGQRAQGVNMCSKVGKDEREKLKKEENDAKRIFGECTRKKPLPCIPIVPPTCMSGTMNEKGKRNDMFRVSSRDEVDGIVARFFYGNGIPFNVARSPFWVDMVRAINDAPKGYKPPSAEKIRTGLLDKERTKVEQALMPIKQQWPTYGVSVVSDGWTNIKNQPLINVMALSGGKAIFVSGVDCSGDEKTGEYIAEILLKAIESVGPYNVVQVLTDNASSCKAAGTIIERRHPHIFWSGCMAHTLSLLMKDIASSVHPCLAFVGVIYKKAKGIAKYIKSHSSSLHIFRAFSALDVIQVKKTRFGHHFVVLERINQVKNALISMVLSEEWDNLKKGGSKSNLEHDGIRKTILDDDFWKDLKGILVFTKPIWRMIRFCDSDKAFIGEVYQRMKDMLADIKVALFDNYEMSHVLENLVLVRWEKVNLPLHTLAYVLTPFYYSEPWLTSLNPVGEKRKKPHADFDVQMAYFDIVDRLVRDPGEAYLVRRQLSDFVSNKGIFARPQAVKDREIMSAVAWWDLYGVTAPELYSLAVKVLSQSVNTSCAERAWSTYGFIHSVKRNKMNTNRAESLEFVHYNHRLLTRYRDDYHVTYNNWDNVVNDDNLEKDMELVEDGEYTRLYSVDIDRVTPQGLQPVDAQAHREEVARGKRTCLR